MRRALFLIALAFLSGGLLYWLMARENGFILLAIGDRVVQLSLWMAVVLAVLALLLWRGIVRSVAAVMRHARGLHSSSLPGTRARSGRRTLRGLTEFFEGRWTQALRTLGDSRRSSLPHIDYLVAATAAIELGDTARARELLVRMTGLPAASALAGLLLQARVHILAREGEAAQSCLQTLLDESPGHPQGLRLAAQLYREARDWAALEGLLPALRSDRNCDVAAIDALELDVYLGLLRELDVPIEGQAAQACKQLEDLWRRVPKAVRRHPRAVAVRAEWLASHGESARAEKELRIHLGQTWDGDLVRLYGRLGSADPQRPLVVAEAWNRQWRENPDVLLTLGRLAAANGLWGKARDHLEHSLRLAPHTETYAALAGVFAELGEPEKSGRCYRLGLEHSLRNVTTTTVECAKRLPQLTLTQAG